jgi:hypothetical protein
MNSDMVGWPNQGVGHARLASAAFVTALWEGATRPFDALLFIRRKRIKQTKRLLE